MEEIKIVHKGKLISKKWVYDDKKEEGEYVVSDVSKYSSFYLFEECSIAQDVVLKNIFILVKSSIKIYKAILGTSVVEVIDEGLKPFEGADEEIEYLLLSWNIDYDKKGKIFHGNILPDFSGVGKEPDRIRYALEYSPANKLANLPLRLSDSFLIHNSSNVKDQSKPPVKATIRSGNFARNILHASIFIKT